MDDGSWGKTVYDKKPYLILDAFGEYYSVWNDYKQIASFKIKEDALEYVAFLQFKPKDVKYFCV